MRDPLLRRDERELPATPPATVSASPHPERAQFDGPPTPPLELDETFRDEPNAPAVPPRAPELDREPPRTDALSDDGSAYYCEHCERYMARGDVRLLGPEGRVALPACPACGRHLRTERSQPTHSLERLLLEALAWPFSREMMPTLAGQTFVFWLFSSWWALGLSLVALVGLALGLGVLATYAAAVIRSTHRGSDAPPPPSDLTATWDVLGALLRHLGVLLVGGFPLVIAVASALLGQWSVAEQTVLVVFGIATLCLYVPAGQIIASTRETFAAALNPFLAIRFALRLGGNYLLACAILLGVALAHLVAVGLTMRIGVAIFGGSSVLWHLVVSLELVLGVLVEARMLGLVVREHRFDVTLI